MLEVAVLEDVVPVAAESDAVCVAAQHEEDSVHLAAASGDADGALLRTRSSNQPGVGDSVLKRPRREDAMPHGAAIVEDLVRGADESREWCLLQPN